MYWDQNTVWQKYPEGKMALHRNIPDRNDRIERDETANVPVARREVREKSWQTRIKRAATLKQPHLNGN